MLISDYCLLAGLGCVYYLLYVLVCVCFCGFFFLLSLSGFVLQIIIKHHAPSDPQARSSWKIQNVISNLPMNAPSVSLLHFNVSVGSDGHSHKTTSTNHNLFEEKGAEAVWNRGPSAYQPNALPLVKPAHSRQSIICMFTCISA